MVLSCDVPEPETLNMTPMVDVVFNLLVFFLLGSTYLYEERELAVELPRVQAASPLTEAPEDIVVNVRADGTIIARNKPYTLSQLETMLKEARENYPDQSVAIRGDKATRYEHVAQVIAACRLAGVSRLDCLVEEP